MRRGRWTLSTGKSVTADAAKVVIADARVAALDFALLAETPAQAEPIFFV